MRYVKLDDYDIYNGPGVRVTLWVAGCPFHCKGCHNSWTWDPNQGDFYDPKLITEILNLLDEEGFHKDFSVLGGEPLAPYNIKDVTEICKGIKEKRPETDIWIWTGNEYEDVKDLEIMKYINTLVCGPFIQELYVKEKYFGSSNQRVIKIQ